MHFPLYLHIGRLTIHPHWIFESLGYFVGFRVYLHLRRNGDPIRDDTRWWIITAAALGAAVGSKLLSLFEEPSYLLAHWRSPYLLLNGKTIVGAIVGGWIAVELCKRQLNETQRTGDLFAIPLCLGIAIGRLGCFLTGPEDHTFGAASTLPWALDVGDGVRRHPLPLYEILFLLLLALTLNHVAGRRHINGDIFKVFLCAYMTWRLLTEFLKDRDPLFLQLTAIQWACLVVLAFSTRDILRWVRREDLRPAFGEGD